MDDIAAVRHPSPDAPGTLHSPTARLQHGEEQRRRFPPPPPSPVSSPGATGPLLLKSQRGERRREWRRKRVLDDEDGERPRRTTAETAHDGRNGARQRRRAHGARPWRARAATCTAAGARATEGVATRDSSSPSRARQPFPPPHARGAITGYEVASFDGEEPEVAERAKATGGRRRRAEERRRGDAAPAPTCCAKHRSPSI